MNDFLKDRENHLHSWNKGLAFTTRPFADDEEINKNLIEQVFRGKWDGDEWKSSDNYLGGLAGSIRREISKGEFVGGKSHITKGLGRLKQIDRILADDRNGKKILSERDREIVRELRRDIKGALMSLIWFGSTGGRHLEIESDYFAVRIGEFVEFLLHDYGDD